MLSVTFKGGLFEAALHYDASIYSAEYIASLSEQYQTLLSDVIWRPDEAVVRLRILSDVERRKLLYGFNPTEESIPKSTRCLHELIEAQVIRTPEARAVICEDQLLSYAELDCRANKLARCLLSRGIGPDTLVAISVERSIEMIVGLLGILKAGGAYVPIDPGYPKDRIIFMLEDSCVSLLLTQERLLAKFPSANVNILCLDRDWPLISDYPAAAPNTCLSPSNLAYVIFTSGSTGRPKGVMVSHANAVHSTEARIDYYDPAISSFLLLSSFSFDSSVAGLFWTLSIGGCLCIPDEEAQKDPLALLGLISQQKISHLLCLPSLYAALLQQATPAQAESICAVIVAGEACSWDIVAQHCGKLSQARLFNEYGPTEGAVWSSVYEVAFLERELSVSIGSPIAHTQIYVLDTSLEPVPIGVSGELYIGGGGLARGY
ncbi:MAG: AMP-binding protein, partial [Nitrososphaera sp.]|nr:AMP-binding protein [Nitrososphaera sp.]